MKSSIRIGAILTLVLLVGYYVLRIIGAQCSGSVCDSYFVPLSLLFPILILVGAAMTGLLAILAARQGIWLGLLIGCTLAGIFGPIVSIVVFRDNPDAFVLVATLLVLLIPLGALSSTFSANRTAG